MNSVSAILEYQRNRLHFSPTFPLTNTWFAFKRHHGETIFLLVASFDGNTQLGALPFRRQAGTMTVLGLES